MNEVADTPSDKMQIDEKTTWMRSEDFLIRLMNILYYDC